MSTANKSHSALAGLSLPELQLLHQVEGETLALMSKYNRGAIGRTVCSFLNGHGGRIVVGVTDHGQLLGVPKAGETAQMLQKELLTLLHPPATLVVSPLTYQETDLLLVEVSPGADGPYAYADAIYVRVGATTQKATTQEVVSLVKNLEHTPRWEAQPCLDCELGDLDEAELQRTGQELNERRYENLPVEPRRLLDALYLIRNGMLTNAAVALYARQATRFLPQMRVRTVYFADDTREQMLDNRTFDGHIFALLTHMTGFLQTHVPVQASLTDPTSLVRAEQLAYPPAALREALLNALVHRDYSQLDGGIQLTLYPRRLELWNAGGLPKGVTIKNLREGGISRPRNPDIAHVLMLRGLVERLGIGGRRITEACRLAGLPAPEWQERAGGMLLTLRLAEEKPTRPKAASVKAAVKLNERIQGFLSSLSTGQRFTSQEYQQQAAAGISDRRARTDLAQMVEAQVVERKGAGPQTYYVRTEQALT